MKKLTKIFNIILMLAFVLVVYGCGENFDRLSLHFSTSQISLSLGESKDYQFEVENYFKSDLHFSYSFDKDIAKVEKTEQVQDGTFKITVTAIVSGDTTLNITLLENNHTIQVPVKVYEDISSFELKSDANLYVLRGNTITFDEKMYNFYPSSTLQTALTYFVNDEQISSNIYSTNDDTADVLHITAQSIYNSDLRVSFDVYVLDEINLQALKNSNMYIIDEGEDAIKVEPVGQETPTTITLVANDQQKYIKKLKFDYDISNDYTYQFLSKNGNINIERYTNSNYENSIFLEIQQLDRNKDLTDELVLRVSHKNYSGYYFDVNYKVEVKLAPKNIKLNGSKESLSYNLFDNNSLQNTKEVVVSVDPIGAVTSEISLTFKLVKEDNTEVNSSYQTLKNYIIVKNNGLEISTEKNIIIPSSTISFYGQKVLEGYKSIRMYFSLTSSLSNETLINFVEVSVKKGAKKFYVDSEYENATIYIKKGDLQDFEGLIVEEADAYIGQISASCDTSQSGYSTIYQIEDNNKTIRILGTEVGQTLYTLSLSNGATTKLRVVVKQELSIDDFMVYLASTSQSNVSQVEYKSTPDPVTLKSLKVANKDSKINLEYIIKPTNVDEEMYSINVTSADNNIEVLNTKTLRTLNISEAPTLIRVELVFKQVNAFKLETHSTSESEYKAYNFNFYVTCFEPISNFNLKAKNDGLKDQDYSKIADCYLNSAYIDTQMSNISLSLTVDNKTFVNSDDKTDTNKYWAQVNWSFSIDSTAYDINDNETTVKEDIEYYRLSDIGSIIYGKFYPKTGIYECSDANSQSENKSFTIIATIENNGQTWSSKVQVNIKKYIKVENIWLKNYQDQIYLDASQTEKTIYTYIVPSNATNQNYAIELVSDENSNLSCLSYRMDTNESITLTYNGNGGGSGTLKIIPYSSYQQDNTYQGGITEIKVKVGDGSSKDNPLHISSWEQFKSIDLNKYYVVDGIIDAHGEEIAPLGVLHGGISGSKDSIIQNFVIKNPTQLDNANYYGLFSILDGDSYLKNLTIKGSFNIEDTNSTNNNFIGLLAGKNLATKITNVHIVIASKPTVKLNGNVTNYIGGMFGQNVGGIIEIDSDDDIDLTTLVEISSDNIFTLELTELTNQSKYYFGGLVGYSEGGKVTTNVGTNITRYNNYGTSAVVNLHINVTGNNQNLDNQSGIGGIFGCAENVTIEKILISGNISRVTSTFYSNNVGGLVGYAKYGIYKNNISRVFVAGKNYVAGLIGHIETNNETKIDNCKVQALDNGLVGLNATMILAYNQTGTTKYHEFYNSDSVTQNVTSNCSAQTFIARTKVDSQTTSTQEYYGDKLHYNYTDVYTDGGQFVTSGSDTIVFANYYNKIKYPNNTIVLMYYDTQSEQSEVLKAKNKQFLPKDILLDTTLEFSITSNNYSIIDVASNGQLTLRKTGTVTLILKNILNISDKMELKVVVTNYVNSNPGNNLQLYTNQNLSIGELANKASITLTNNNKYVIYPKFSSLISDMGITLTQNQDLKLLIVADKDKINIEQQYGAIYLSGIIPDDGIIDDTPSIINFYIYLDLGNGDYRFLTSTGEFVPVEDTNNITYKDDNDNEVLLSSFDLTFVQTLDVYNLSIDKTNIILAPMDTIDINLSFQSQVDPHFTFEVYYLDGEDYLSSNEVEQYFNVTSSWQNNGINYVLTYIISMKTENIRIGSYIFYFKSHAENIEGINVTYITQPINNVDIKNYNDHDDINKIAQLDNNGETYYNTSYSMQESNSVVAGGINILRVTITPYYCDYSYIEITNSQQNIDTNRVLLFSLLLPEDNFNKRYISTKSYYIPNGIRIYKRDIDSNSISRGDLTVLYRLYNNVVEGDKVDLVINFYNENGEKVFAEQTKTLVIDIEKTISVSLVRDNISSNVEYIARGLTYALDVKYIGYNAEDIRITSLSPYITIKNIGSTYYLEVSSNVSYGSGTGIDARLEYYGLRMVNGSEVKSSAGSVQFTIVEYVLDYDKNDLKSLFDDTPLELNVKNTVSDIRTLIAEKIKFEGSQSATNAIKALKNNIVNNAKFKYLNTENDQYVELSSDTYFRNKYIQINGYSVTPLYVGENAYSFQVGLSSLTYQSGYIEIIVDEEIDNNTFKQIDVNINQSISNKNYLPITSYSDFMSMKENGKYRLTCDITLSDSFTPIETEILELDGNGFSIILRSKFVVNNVTNYGLFSQIGENTIVKNLTIKLYEFQEVGFTFQNTEITEEFNFGLLAGINKGIITNCAVKLGNEISSLVVNNFANSEYSSSSNIAGFVAKNEGYITNSHVEIRMDTSGANLAGFVAENYGHIASCYVKNSLIKNSSQDVKHSTSGFVKTNSGEILNSFIEGKYSQGQNKIYCENSNFAIKASSIASTFIYNNKGTISDCYANIPITSSSQNSGFVCINEGSISNSYTTSRLGDSDTINYPFIITNVQGKGGLKNCYFLSDDNYNKDVNKSNDNYDESMLRKSTLLEFALNRKITKDTTTSFDYKITGEELFSTFVFNSNQKQHQGVWFYATTGEEIFGDDDDNLSKYNNHEDILIKTSTYNKYLRVSPSLIQLDDYKYQNALMSFISMRPQLVSANTLAFSQYLLDIDNSKADEETGEVIYAYKQSDNCEYYGSSANPILISTAQEMESTIYNDAITNKKTFTKSIRLISDIDYLENKITISSLYNIIFAGQFEGNGLTVSGYSLNTNESLFSAGFFSQIGHSDYDAYIQNVIFTPNYINMPNARVVGAICGTLFKANAYNIKVLTSETNKNSLAIIGKNIVGGLFGRTLSEFEIKNATSSVSVNAVNLCSFSDWTSDEAQSLILYDEYAANTSTISYAGTVVGYVGGMGTVQNVSCFECASVGMVSGLLFGGIGINASVSYIDIAPSASSNCFIRASVYGGILAGEILGKVSYITIGSEDEDLDCNIFKNSPIVAQALGGVCGIIRGGTIDYCDVVYNITTAKDAIISDIVGGLVGKLVQNGTISNSTFNGTVKAAIKVGGLIGQVDINCDLGSDIQITNCTLKDISLSIVKPASKTINGKYVAQVYIGSLVGALNTTNNDTTQTRVRSMDINEVTGNITYNVQASLYGTGDNLVVYDYDVIGGCILEGEAINTKTIDVFIKITKNNSAITPIRGENYGNYNLKNYDGNEQDKKVKIASLDYKDYDIVRWKP